MKRAAGLIAILLLLLAADGAFAQTGWFGADSSEVVNTTTASTIGSGLAPTFQFRVATGNGYKFARCGFPLIITLAPAPGTEVNSSPREEMWVSAVSGDTLTVIKRKTSNTAQTAWPIGSYCGIRVSYQTIKQLQDSLRGFKLYSDSMFAYLTGLLKFPDTLNKTGKVLAVQHSGLAWINAGLGTVTSIVVDLPLFVVGGGGAITMSGEIAEQRATSLLPGYLDPADFNRFDGKQDTLPTLDSGKVLSNDGDVLLWTASGTGTVKSVNGSGGTTGMSVSGGPITVAGTLTLGGTLKVDNGGTGAANAVDALNNLLPSQTGHPGEALFTDGFGVPYWDSAGTGSGGGGVTSVAVSGGSTGLTTSGGPITSSGTITIAGTLDETNGGTNQNGYTKGDLLYASNTDVLSKLAGNTTGTKKFLTQTGTGSVSAAPVWGTLVSGDIPSLDASIVGSGTLPVIHGGTGTASYTNGQLLIGNTSGGTLTAATLTGTSNQVNVSNGNGSITLSTPQSIAAASSPTFASMTLTNTANQLVLGTTNTTTISATAPAASRVYTMPDVLADANFVMTQGNQTLSGQKTFGSTIVGSVTGNSGTVTNGVYLTGSQTISGAKTFSATQTFTTAPLFKIDDIKTTYTDGAILANTTASDATNTVQQSPTLEFRSNVWGNGADSSRIARITLVPVTATNPTSALNIHFGNSGLTFTNELSLTSAGVLDVAGSYKIGGTSVLTSTTLGGAIVNSSLTSLGTIATGVWQGTLIDPTYGGTGVNNGASTITLAGNLVTSGANALTLTTTGATNVTLPTSGTLVNSAVTALSSLASIGTITTGVWNGTVVTVPYGGTGVATLALNGVLYGNGAGSMLALAVNSTGTNKFLIQSSSNAPAWATIVAGDVPTLNQNTTGSAATLTTARAIYGNNFDGSAALTQIIASTYGGVGNGFTKFSGPTASEKTFTLPDASATLAYLAGGQTFTGGLTINGGLTLGTVLSIGNGGTGQATANLALNALLPSQTGNNGKTLQTDGTNTSWAAAGSGTVTSVATGSGLTGGTITSTGTLSLDPTSANTFTALQTVNKAGITTTSTAGVELNNATAADATNTIQYSPALEFDAAAWKVNATAASQAHIARIELQPVSAATVTYSNLIAKISNNGASYLTLLSLNSNGPSVTTTNAAEAIFGDNTNAASDVYFGSGKQFTGGNGTNAVLHGTNGNGASKAGGNLDVQAGLSTGSGTAGSVSIKSAFAAASSSTLNTVSALATFVPSGTAGSSAVSTLTVGAAGASTGKIVLSNNTNSNTYTITPVAPSASRTYSVQDAGAAADFLMETADLSTNANYTVMTTSTRGKLTSVGPTTLSSAPADPSGTSQSSYKMMGINKQLTTSAVGTAVFVEITGNLDPGATGSPLVTVSYGTGAPPANGDAATGTATGSAVTATGIANGAAPFTCSAVITGLSVSTAYWFDLQLKSDGTSTATVKNLYISAWEIH